MVSEWVQNYLVKLHEIRSMDARMQCICSSLPVQPYPVRAKINVFVLLVSRFVNCSEAISSPNKNHDCHGDLILL